MAPSETSTTSARSFSRFARTKGEVGASDLLLPLHQELQVDRGLLRREDVGEKLPLVVGGPRA